jgi:hypothetical protein
MAVTAAARGSRPVGAARMATAGVDNPLAVHALGGVLRAVNQGAPAVTLLAVLAAAGSLVGRFRRARGIERQQLRWVALAAPLVALVTAAIPTTLALNDLWLFEWAAGLSVVILPVAIGAAILRYRLRRAHRPDHRRLSRRRGGARVANLLVYGRRAAPYEVLSELSRGLTGASTDDSLVRMARLVVEAIGVDQATVWLRLGEQLQPHARWPETRPLPVPIALEGPSVEHALAGPDSRSRSFPVQHEDELLGALTVTVAPAEPRTPASEKLIADLAAQTGLGLRFEHMKERALFARALASFLPPRGR